jgi:peptide/nickel transport system permease protein
MWRYIIRRLLLIIPTLLGITVIGFAIIQLAPGSPVMMKMRMGAGGEGLKAQDAGALKIVEETKKLYGLDKPIHVRYLIWLRQVATFDFGSSYKDHRRVLDKILEALPITLQLNIISILLVYLISIPMGVYSATHEGSVTDKLMTVASFIFYSMPGFWLALMLIVFFGVRLDWFPIYGINSAGAESFPWWKWLGDRLWHHVLPVTVYTVGGFAFMSRLTRQSMQEVLRQDYIRTARAKGLPEWKVIYKHALRNAIMPIITILAGLLPEMLGGSVIIEQIFSINGMGKLAFEAVLSRDYPLIMGEFFISALLSLIGILMSDIAYVLVDPRVTFENLEKRA